MENDRAKKGGFTLLEVVISMAILSIMSVGIYNGYMIMIIQIKEGQVRQEATLEGKKILEEIQSTREENDITLSNNQLSIGDTELTLDSNNVCTRFLEFDNDGFVQTTESAAKYIETITVTPTNGSINLNTNEDKNAESDKFYISKVNSQYYISLYSADDGRYCDSKIPLPIKIEAEENKMEIYVYLETSSTENEQKIEIKDYQGKLLLSEIKKNLVINFNDYRESNGSVPTNIKIEINVYNKTSETSDVYIERQSELDVNIEPRKGSVNIHDDIIEEMEQKNVGTLYDIKVEIMKKEDNIALFTGYSQKNINIEES